MSLKKLGRYDIVRPLGKGAMGLVYEAHDPNIDRQVAIKTIRVDQLSADMADEYESRFRAEARAGGRLQHPNIIGVYDAGRDEGMAFMVMELVRGGDLKERLEHGARLGLARSLVVMRELLSALGFAHEQGIIHRDIKPANVMLDSKGRVKLGDFGVARISHSGDATRTQGSMVGTLKYMSPEQVQGLPVDARSDLFAAGVVLYQLLTGRKPFEGANDFAIMQAIAQQEPAPPSSLDPSLPAALDAVVAKALAKDREARYATARDFMVALRAATAATAGTPAARPAGAESADTVPIVDQAHRQAAAPSLPFGHSTSVSSSALPGAPSAGQRSGDEMSIASSSPGTSSPHHLRPLPAVGPDPTGTSASALAQEMELFYWKDIQISSDPVDFQGFLQQFPAGIYAGLAARRLRRLAGAPGESTGSRSAIGPAAVGLDPALRRDATSSGAGPSSSSSSSARPGDSTSSGARPRESSSGGGPRLSASDSSVDRTGAAKFSGLAISDPNSRTETAQVPNSGSVAPHEATTNGDRRRGASSGRLEASFGSADDSAARDAARQIAAARAAEEEARWQEAMRLQAARPPADATSPSAAAAANESRPSPADAARAAARRAEADRLAAEAQRAAERRWLGTGDDGSGAGGTGDSMTGDLDESARPSSSSFIDLSTGPVPLAAADHARPNLTARPHGAASTATGAAAPDLASPRPPMPGSISAEGAATEAALITKATPAAAQSSGAAASSHLAWPPPRPRAPTWAIAATAVVVIAAAAVWALHARSAPDATTGRSINAATSTGATASQPGAGGLPKSR